MNPTKSFLYISIVVIILGVLVTTVKAEPLHRTVCGEVREANRKSCALTFKTTMVKARISLPTTKQKLTKKLTSLPAKAEHEIPAPADTGAATFAGTAALDEVRTERLVLPNFTEAN